MDDIKLLRYIGHGKGKYYLEEFSNNVNLEKRNIVEQKYLKLLQRESVFDKNFDFLINNSSKKFFKDKNGITNLLKLLLIRDDIINFEMILNYIHFNKKKYKFILNELFIWAAFYNLKIFQYLFEKGVELNFKDQYGNTSLHYAVLKNNPNIVNFLLLKTGINVNILNRNLKTPLDIAIKQENLKLKESLLQHNANYGSVIIRYNKKKKRRIYNYSILIVVIIFFVIFSIYSEDIAQYIIFLIPLAFFVLLYFSMLRDEKKNE